MNVDEIGDIADTDTDFESTINNDTLLELNFQPYTSSTSPIPLTPSTEPDTIIPTSSTSSIYNTNLSEFSTPPNNTLLKRKLPLTGSASTKKK